MRFFRSLFLGLLLAGCSLAKRDRPKPEPAGTRTTLVGIVEMVNPEQNYVLIRCEQVPVLAAGTALIALDASGAEAALVLSPERKGRYLTADIRSGQPQVSNLVLHRTTASPATASASAAAAESAAPQPSTVPPPTSPPVAPMPLEPPADPAPALPLPSVPAPGAP